MVRWFRSGRLRRGRIDSCRLSLFAALSQVKPRSPGTPHHGKSQVWKMEPNLIMPLTLISTATESRATEAVSRLSASVLGRRVGAGSRCRIWLSVRAGRAGPKASAVRGSLPGERDCAPEARLEPEQKVLTVSADYTCPPTPDVRQSSAS